VNAKLELARLSDSLLTKGEKVTIFCGAGVSYPSQVPLVYPIISGLLARLGAGDAEIKKIIGAGIPFEVFMELFKEHIDIDPIFELFTNKVPNYDHKVMASLAKAGYCSLIITTNFDTLIEQALEDERLVENTEFIVYAKDEEFATIDWDSKLIKIIKIHGTATHIDSIKIIMSKIASSSVSDNLKEVINQAFSLGAHQNVLVLGYSCSDHFDVTKILINISEPFKNVIFIEHHDTKVEPDSWINEDIRLKKTNNPFKRFEGSIRVNAETKTTLEFIASKLALEPEPVTKIPDFDPNKALDNVFATIPEKKLAMIKSHALGRLLIKSANYVLAENRMKQSLNAALKAKDYFFIAQGYLNLGIINYRLSRPIDAIRMYKFTLRILENHDIKRPERYKKLIKSNTLGNIGNVLYGIRKLRFAEYFQLAALKIATDENFEQLAANSNGNLGIVYFEGHQYSLALKFNTAALTLADKIGDPEGIARHNYNIGCCQIKLNHPRLMHRFFKIALEIFKLIGRADGIAYLDVELGKYYFDKKMHFKARAHLRKAVAAVEHMNGLLIQADCYEYLGDVYAAIDNKQKSLKYYQGCKIICENSDAIWFKQRSQQLKVKIEKL
jgi:tetratricopeptide (TPR) repeat protein